MKAEAKAICEIEPSKIRIDGGTQVRVSLDDATVAEYREHMEAYVEFPPIVVFYDGSTYWLADGFHRYHAFRKTGRDKIKCEVRTGDRRDAVLYAVGANSQHGLRRNNQDKRNAVTLLLNDDEWRDRSDNWIAETCGVSHPFVGTVRKQLVTVTGSHPGRMGKDGKIRSELMPIEKQVRAWISEAASRVEPVEPSIKAAAKKSPKPAPNVIGDLKSQVDSFIGELVEGQPACVCMAIADHLELLAQDLRK